MRHPARQSDPYRVHVHATQDALTWATEWHVWQETPRAADIVKRGDAVGTVFLRSSGHVSANGL